MNQINLNKTLNLNIMIFLFIGISNLSAKTFMIDHLFRADNVERQKLIDKGIILDADIRLCDGTLHIRHDACTNNKNELEIGEHSKLSIFLKTLKDKNIAVSIDVKSGQSKVFEATINAIREYALDESRFIFWVRSHNQAKYVRKYSQNVKVAYWAGNGNLQTVLASLEKENSHNIFMIGVYAKKKDYACKADYVHNILGLKIAFQIFDSKKIFMLKKSDFIIVDSSLKYVTDNSNEFKPYYSTLDTLD